MLKLLKKTENRFKEGDEINAAYWKFETIGRYFELASFRGKYL
jgi:hypothetical protein